MHTSEYKTIQPPFTLNFCEMSKKELRAYFEWFQQVMPERIELLAWAVKSSPGFENWKPDYLRKNLSRNSKGKDREALQFIFKLLFDEAYSLVRPSVIDPHSSFS